MRFELILFITFFPVILWAVIFLFTSRMTGWSTLSRFYQYDGELPAQKHSRVTLVMRRLSRYKHIVTVCSDSRGLFFSMPKFFRIGHPTLFIPWHEIRISRNNDFSHSFIELGFQKAPDIFVRLSESEGAKILGERPKA